MLIMYTHIRTHMHACMQTLIHTYIAHVHITHKYTRAYFNLIYFVLQVAASEWFNSFIMTAMDKRDRGDQEAAKRNVSLPHDLFVSFLCFAVSHEIFSITFMLTFTNVVRPIADTFVVLVLLGLLFLFLLALVQPLLHK